MYNCILPTFQVFNLHGNQEDKEDDYNLLIVVHLKAQFETPQIFTSIKIRGRKKRFIIKR
jgi:hypothetical protein